MHNHHHTIKFFEQIRAAIREGRFEAFAARAAEGAQGMGFQEAPLPAAVLRLVDVDQEPRSPPASLTLGG